MLLSTLLTAALAVLPTSAFPSHNTTDIHLLTSLARQAPCTFTDFNTFKARKDSCTTIILSNLFVPAGQTLDLSFRQRDVRVQFAGTTTFGYASWTGPLISFSGTGLHVTGAPGHNLNGQGSRWWDRQGDHGQSKPTFMTIFTRDSTFQSLRIIDAPHQVVEISGASHTHLDDFTISIPNGEARGALNTDGFGINRSDDITITNSHVENQDDCIVVNSGSNLHFSGITCKGSHGLAIAVGQSPGQVVSNVEFHSCTMIGSKMGPRIKSVAGSSGTISGVKYIGITLQDITDYGIAIEQNYRGGRGVGEPTSGVKVEGVTLQGITGSVGPRAEPVHIICGKGTCSGFTVGGIDIRGGVRSECVNSPTKGCL